MHTVTPLDLLAQVAGLLGENRRFYFSTDQMISSGVFITGTDTGIGKTVIACHLIKVLEETGLKVAVRKPVESGCLIGEHGLIAEDATRLASALVSAPSTEQVCPYRYKAETSPERAAMLAGTTHTIVQLAACCYCEEQFVVVEGAGGLLSPIAADGLNVDLISALGFPAIVVSPDRLGCINHILLTLEALAARHLKVIAVVLNRMHPQTDESELDNARELSAWTNLPIIQVYKDHISRSALSELVGLLGDVSS